MSFWTFVIVALALFAIADLIQKVVDNGRQTRLAKIEADLKRDLVQRLGDADLVAKVVEAKLPIRPMDADSDEDDDGIAVAPKAVVAKASVGLGEDDASGSGILLGGMVCLLVGAAFIVLWAAADDDFIVPGAIVTAVGLALLAYPSARDELQRSRRRRLEQQRQESSAA